MSNLLRLFEKNEKTISELERAEERLREKSFYENFKSLQIVCENSQYALPVFSAITGSFSLAYPLSTYLHLYAAISIALILLAIWERTKCLLLIKNFELYYTKGSTLGIGLSLASLIFAGGSIYLSVTGARELSYRTDNTEARINEIFENKKDSINSIYGSRIAEAEKQAKEYFDGNNYNGVIRYSKDEKFADHYRKLNSRVIELNEQQEVKLLALENTKRARLINGQNDYEKITYALLTVIFIIELLIILVNWFLVFFDYRIHKEDRLLTSAINSKVSINSSDVVQVFQSYILPKLLPNTQSITASAPASTGRIGFQTTFNKSASNQEEPRENQENSLLSAANEQDLIQEIKAGKRDYRSLMKKYKVNVLTLKNYIESYGKE